MPDICESLAIKRPFAATVWREGYCFVSQCLEADVADQGATEEEALLNLKEALEAAEYFDTHFGADIWDGLPPTKPLKLPPSRAKSIRERHAAAKSPISIRLIPEQIAAAKKIAAAKSVGY